MSISFLNELSCATMPLRVTEPAQVELVRRLGATGQIHAVFEPLSEAAAATVVAITPLGRKVVNCARTGDRSPHGILFAERDPQ